MSAAEAIGAAAMVLAATGKASITIDGDPDAFDYVSGLDGARVIWLEGCGDDHSNDNAR